MRLSDPISGLKGVGDDIARKLTVLNVRTIGELVDYLPRRYEDYSDVVKVKHLRPGAVTLQVRINNVTGRYVRRGMHITEAIASDDTGSVKLVWFNQPYRAAALRSSVEYYVAGEYALRRQRFSILNPSVELVSDFPINTARIIPIYPETKGLKSSQIRKLVRQAIIDVDELPEHLPAWLLAREQLVNYPRAITQMHFPSGRTALAMAEKRLAFEEVFELSLAALLNKEQVRQEKSLAIPFDEKLAKDFVSRLSFKLTDAQRKVAWQIYGDMSRTAPMNRLLEGDVGSGKTVVAAMAAIMAMRQGYQVALMTPTELLARQHADSLVRLLTPVGMADKVSLLIGAIRPKQKALLHEQIADGQTSLIVGTHALIAQKVDIPRLGLIIIDEQHRFGVEQRKKLQAKAGHLPHVLHLSATPIPRSLALTLYGELDISVLDQMPPGRQKTLTRLVSPNSRAQIYENIVKTLSEGRQMFIVCPQINESETDQALAAETVYKRAVKDFKGWRVGLLHGRMKSAEKEKVMRDFLDHNIDILVSTTVIEVGVDVPNATVMLIEGAEHFGLAQIHQLRGRVGRGTYQSYCYLVMGDSRAPSQRLSVLENTSDGFKLAEYDLQLRGPGAIYGTIQHGLLDLRVAKLSDTRLIAAARAAAQAFIGKKEDLRRYPYLDARVKKLRAVTNLN